MSTMYEDFFGAWKKVLLVVVLLAAANVGARAESGTITIVDYEVTNATYYYLGATGSNNYLRITDGGAINAASSCIGFNTNANNNTALVTGFYSLWYSSSEIAVGMSGWGNHLTIAKDASVISTGGVLGNNSTSSNNTVVVTDPGSVWQNEGDLYVGIDGAGNSLTIANGANVNDRIGMVGNLLNLYSGNCAPNNSVLVSGPGSVWQNRANLYLAGTNNRVTVDNGAWLLVGNVATQNLPALPGIPGAVYGGVAVAGNGNLSLVIGNGSTLASGIGYIGYASNERGSVEVSGSGSVWNNQDALYVGYSGWGNNLTIENGASVINRASFLGVGSASSNNSVVVSGTGSFWINNGNLTIGNSGPGNNLTIAAGASVSSFSGFLGNNSSSGNNSVLVTGTGSAWNMSGLFFVGNSGWGNNLTIANGATVFSSTGLQGYNSSSSNNSILVTGSGSVWSNASDIYIGFNGAGNSLTITNGGLVAVGGNATIGYNNTGNQLTIAGGNLAITNAGLTGTLEVRQGALTFNGGTIAVNQLLASSVIAFNGGTLQTGGSAVSNGAVFVVGDGTQAATLDLRGGTHNFADGLNIASNATLTGTGTLVAPLTLGGGATLAPGHSPGLLIVSNALTLSQGSIFEVGLAGYLADTEYDQVLVTGAVTNNNATLSLSLAGGFVPTNGAHFIIMDNNRSMVGIFNGAPEGSTNTFDSSAIFAITYAGGTDGHDVVLTVIPEPGSALLTGLFGLLVVGWRRLRRWHA